MKRYRQKKAVLLLTVMTILVQSLLFTGCQSKTEETSLDNIDPAKYVTLGEYKGLPIKADQDSVSDADVEKNIQNILESHAELKEVNDRAARMGDTVNIDYEGKLDGVAFDGGTGNNDLELGSGMFIPGFEEGVVGMKTGEEKDLPLSFPEQYHSEELAGKDVVFHVKVNSISEKDIPQLTDEFVKSLGVDAGTADEYRDYIKKQLTEQYESTTKANQESELLKTAVDNAKCNMDELPEWLVSENAAEFRSSTESFVSQYGLTIDDYLAQVGSDQAKFEAEAQEYGKEKAKSDLVVLSIAKDEGLQITDKELEDYYTESAGQYNTTAEQMKKAIPEDELKRYLLQQKVMDFLFDNAKTL